MAIHITVGSHEDFETVEEFAESGKKMKWPVPKTAAPGDTILFLIPSRTGEIVAAGVLRSTPIASKHWTNKYQGEIDGLGLRRNRIPIELLRLRFPNWGYLDYARGYSTVPEDHAPALLEMLNLERPLDVETGTSADELDPTLRYYEGTVRAVLVNAHERSAAARDACIAKFGAKCAVCQFDFGAVYGPVAEGFIHVHHLVSLSEIGEEYQVDPVNDLRPVCPNCHAVIHRRTPPYSIEEVKAMLAAQQPA